MHLAGELSHVEVEMPESVGFEFDVYRYFPLPALLLKDGQRVKIGSRALALLDVLVRNAGTVVPYSRLTEAAWPNLHIEETNLRVQLASLRRILGEGMDGMPLILNSPGEGYSLASTVRPTSLDRRTDGGARGTRPPLPLTRLVGREEEVQATLALVSEQSLVTLVGAGGIGKTRVAIEASLRLLEQQGRSVSYVDLAPVASGNFVLTAIALSLGVDLSDASSAFEAVIQALQADDFLIVLDNCEHVLDAVRDIVLLISSQSEGTHILATSREPLALADEKLLRLGGLDFPEGDDNLHRSQLESYSAIALFRQHADAKGEQPLESDEDLQLVASLCRSLDGIPLAIELAAGRTSQIGLRAVAQNLDKQFTLLAGGRRTALPRHRTLRATLEWSYGLLSSDEAALLCQLSVFRSTFSVEAACSISALPASVVTATLPNLIAKSLVMSSESTTGVRHRLLETTRAFAEEKLAAKSEQYDIRVRHAEFFCDYFSDNSLHARPTGQRVEEFRHIVDDVRSALLWTMSEEGDQQLGVRLAVASAPLWLRLSLLPEYTGVLDGAVQRLANSSLLSPGELVPLYPMLHMAHFNVGGVSTKISNMLVAGLEQAKMQGDFKIQLAYNWSLFGIRLTEAKYSEALEYSQEFAKLAPLVDDPMQRAMADRIVALATWRAGDLAGARSKSERALNPVESDQNSFISHSLIYKQGVAARGNASNLLWIRGESDRALNLADEAVLDGLDNDVVGLCYSLAQTIVPLAFWVGDLHRARSLIELLLDHAERNEFEYWGFWGRCYAAALETLESARPEGGHAYLALQQDRLSGLQKDILATIMDGVPRRIGPAVSASGNWCGPELLRRSGQAQIAAGNRTAGRSQLLEALEWAKRDGALAWELRAALSLAELTSADGDRTTGRALVETTLAKFTQSQSSLDFRRAVDFVRGL